MADFSQMTAEIERDKTVKGSAIALISGFQSQLDAAIAAAVAANDEADLTALTDLSAKLSAETDSLAAAVVAGTPGAPPA